MTFRGLASRCALCVVATTAIGCGTDEPVAASKLPSAPIEVIRDDNGVPHIYGASDRDAFFGAGYMMAEDRLLQVDTARRRALGRWAEVLPGHLEDDKLARLFDWRGLGEQAARITARDNPEEWRIMQAWVAGLNKRIDEVRDGKVPPPYGFGPDELDYLPERWNDADVLVVAKMIEFGNDDSIEFELFQTIAERLFPDKMDKVELPRPVREVWTVPPEDRPKDLPAALQLAAGARDFAPDRHLGPVKIDPARFSRSMKLLDALSSLRAAGSNNWAIDGRFTDSTRPMLAGDPHLGFGFPGVFYALHIDSADQGGSFNAAGFSFPGLPGVSIGQTDKVAWSPTTAFADVMDVWEVPSPDFDTVEIGGAPVTVTERQETIRVRGAGLPAGEGDDVVITERDIPGQGVILPADLAPIPVASAGHELFMRWIGYGQSGPSRLLGLNRTHSIDDFDAAVDQQNGLNFNMLAADATGITLRVGIDVPDRDPRKGVSPWKVMDGTNAASLWNGAMLPRDHLPRARAADRGWINTANNDPFGFSADGRVDDDPWYYGAFFAPGWRAGRASDELTRLAKAGHVSVADMQALQLDLHSNMADDLLPLLDAAWAKADHSDADLATLMQALDAWDRRMDRPSSGALVFNVWVHFAASSALEDDLGVLYAPAFDLEAVFMLKVATLLLRGDYPGGDALLQSGRDAVLLDALNKTADFLRQRFGSVDPAGYSYGDLHVTKWYDALGAGLDFGENPSDGGESTVNVSPHSFLDGSQPGQRWPSHYGPILRMVADFEADGTPHIRYNFPLGNVCDPHSPHFDDMRDGWLNGKYHDMRFKRADVDAHQDERIVIE